MAFVSEVSHDSYHICACPRNGPSLAQTNSKPSLQPDIFGSKGILESLLCMFVCRA